MKRLFLFLVATGLVAQTLPPGLYVGDFAFNSTQVVCQPGAKIDGRVTLTGTGCLLQGCEIFQSADGVGDAVDNFCSGAVIRGNTIHNTHGNGIGAWSLGQNPTVEDNILLYTGYGYSPGAHGIYVQSETAALIRRNAVVQFGWVGLHGYGEQGRLDNITYQGNTVAASGPQIVYGLLLGGALLSTLNPVMQENRAYFSASSQNWPQGNDIGYIAGCSGGSVTGNYFAGGYTPFEIFSPQMGHPCAPSQSGNTFFSHPGKKQANATFIEQTSYGWLVTACNWKHSGTISVSVPGTTNGQQLRVWSAEDPLAIPRLLTVSRGTLSIPVSGWTVATPLRGQKPPSMLPEFGVFVVKP